jgi:hypothetical protein
MDYSLRKVGGVRELTPFKTIVGATRFAYNIHLAGISGKKSIFFRNVAKDAG